MSGNLPTTFNEANYAQLLNQVKSRIREARVRAGLAANRELAALYREFREICRSLRQNLSKFRDVHAEIA
jgi:hypothetical protein